MDSAKEGPDLKFKPLYLFVFALILSALLLSAVVSPVWYDDAGHWLVAKSAAEGKGLCYPLNSSGDCDPASPFITMGPVLAWPLAFWMRMLGSEMLIARLLMVILSLCSLALLWRLASRLTNSSKGMIAVGILAINIQFLTYGAELLGEVPMMGCLLLGLLALLNWQHERHPGWAMLGLVAMILAIGIKEYALLPIGLGFLLVTLFHFGKWRTTLRYGLLGAAMLFSMLAWMFWAHGGWEGLENYLAQRGSYQSEFLALDFGLSVKYILFKPLIWLGMVAMVIRLRVKQREEEKLMLAFQGGLLIFFLLSAGYDRLGFLLCFIPSIYLAEFIPFLWKEAGRKPQYRSLKRIGLLCLLLLVFGQQSFPILAKRSVEFAQKNEVEKAVAAELAQHQERQWWIFDQHLVPFLKEGQQWRLVPIVPSKGRHCREEGMTYYPSGMEGIVAGPYAQSEYADCLPWQHLDTIWQSNAEQEWLLLLPRQ